MQYNIIICLLFFSNGADINAMYNSGKTCLHSAATTNCKNADEFLIYHGVDINKARNDGKAPLFVQLAIKSLETTEFLILNITDGNA